MLKSCSQPKLKYIEVLIPISPKHVSSYFIRNNLQQSITQNPKLPKIYFSRCNVTRPWICLNFCLKSRSSSFSFSFLQQSTHHHPSCYLHQFLFIRLQTSFIIMFICFSMGLAKKNKNKTSL